MPLGAYQRGLRLAKMHAGGFTQLKLADGSLPAIFEREPKHLARGLLARGGDQFTLHETLLKNPVGGECTDAMERFSILRNLHRDRKTSLGIWSDFAAYDRTHGARRGKLELDGVAVPGCGERRRCFRIAVHQLGKLRRFD